MCWLQGVALAPDQVERKMVMPILPYAEGASWDPKNTAARKSNSIILITYPVIETQNCINPAKLPVLLKHFSWEVTRLIETKSREVALPL